MKTHRSISKNCLFVCIVFMSQSTIFQPCWVGGIASWVVSSTIRDYENMPMQHTEISLAVKKSKISVENV